MSELSSEMYNVQEDDPFGGKIRGGNYLFQYFFHLF